MKKYNIAQIGSFDVENYGDLLFPIVLENELKKRIKINKIYLFSPNGGVQPFYKNKVYPIKDLEKVIKSDHIDIIVIGGGDVIRLDKIVTLKYNFSYDTSFSFWQVPILLGLKYNIKVVFNSPGVPFGFTFDQLQFSSLLLDQVEYLSVRDENSKKLLGDRYQDKCIVVPDTINAISDIYSKAELIENFQKLQKKKIVPKVNDYIVIQTKKIAVMQDDIYIKKIKELLEYITRVEKKYVFIMPIGYVHNDIDFCRELIDKSNTNIILIKEKLHPYDMLSILASSKGFIGTSLHGIITSNAYNVPILAINIEKLVKINGFLKLINKENLEVNNIEECLFKYKLDFSNQSFDSNSKLKCEINHHFDTIKDIIISLEKEKKSNFEYDLLNCIYNIIDKNDNNLQVLEQMKNENVFFKNQLSNVVNSKSFKITAPLRKTIGLFSKIKNCNNQKKIYSSKLLEKLNKKIAIQIHIYYPELLDEIYKNLIEIPYQYDLYISTDSKLKQKVIIEFFKNKKNVENITVEVYENRGRDIYPFLIQLKDRIKEYDYVLHLHTKKSKYCDYGDSWRKYLYYNLLGNSRNIKSIFYKFEKNKKIGLIFPKTYESVKSMMEIGGSRKSLGILCDRLKICNRFDNIFPAGSMFWAKTDAIYPLFEVVRKKDFAEENGQIDGTFAHAIERVFVLLAQSRGYKYLQTINEFEEK